MVLPIKIHPFDNFKTAITDPEYFFGRTSLITQIKRYPFTVQILLGGRRIGKTSTLRAIEWEFLNPGNVPTGCPFPVFIALNVEQPESLNHLRYILIRSLGETMCRWKKASNNKRSLHQIYNNFLKQIVSADVAIGPFLKLKISNPRLTRQMDHESFREALIDALREFQNNTIFKPFEGICFLLDEAEYIVSCDWSDDAWSYFRGLKDTDTALKSLIGLIISGYRDVKDYHQKIGSALHNISDIHWLTNLSGKEMRLLINQRAKFEGLSFDGNEIQTIQDWSGGHPFLLQQILNTVFDDRLTETFSSMEDLFTKLLRIDIINHTFSSWWNSEGKTDGLSETERQIYYALMQSRKLTIEELSRSTNLSESMTDDGLVVLSGTGLVNASSNKYYTISNKLFQAWVMYRSGKSSVKSQ